LDKALAFLLANIWSWQTRESDYSKMAEAEALLASMMSEIFIPLIMICKCKQAQLILSKDR